jgi:anti-sigma factor RsiW
MKDTRQTCDPNLLELFFDGELDKETYRALYEHATHCPACRKALEENRSLGRLVRAGVMKEASRARLKQLDAAAFIRSHKTEGKVRWRKGAVVFLKPRFWIPATAAVVAAFFFLTFFNPVPAVFEPSALVQSLKGEVASVMILEIPGSGRTVLWFEEGLGSNGEMGLPGNEAESSGLDFFLA